MFSNVKLVLAAYLTCYNPSDFFIFGRNSGCLKSVECSRPVGTTFLYLQRSQNVAISKDIKEDAGPAMLSLSGIPSQRMKYSVRCHNEMTSFCFSTTQDKLFSSVSSKSRSKTSC